MYRLTLKGGERIKIKGMAAAIVAARHIGPEVASLKDDSGRERFVWDNDGLCYHLSTAEQDELVKQGVIS